MGQADQDSLMGRKKIGREDLTGPGDVHAHAGFVLIGDPLIPGLLMLFAN